MEHTERSDRLTALGEWAQALNEVDSSVELYHRALEGTRTLVSFDAAVICTTTEEGVFVPEAVVADRLIPSEPLSTDEGIAGRTLRDGQSIIVEDLATDTTATPTTDAFQSVISIPIGDDTVMQLFDAERDAFTTADVQLGELIAAYVEEARRRIGYETTLSHERDEFAALFENVPDPALKYRRDEEGLAIESINSAFVRTFEFGATNAIGNRLEDLLIPESEFDTPEGAISMGDRVRGDVEVTRQTADGTRPFLLRHVPTGTTEGSPTGYLIYTDITDLKERERALQRQNERLEKFASIVSHDLRNPLSVASGYLEAARNQESPDDEHLREIGRAHERMEQLIANILTLAREGADVEETSRIELGAVIREAWDNVESTGATLKVDEDPVVVADRPRLLQLVENLVRNSVEHGGENVTVRVGVLEEEPGFFVEDDGPGIPKGIRDRVFESGYSHGDDGTGIGLAIVKRIAEAHDWSVRLTEGTDSGARFEFVGVEFVDQPDRWDSGDR